MFQQYVFRAVIKARAKDWQEVQPNYYAWFLNPDDASLLPEYEDSRLEKCLSNKVMCRSSSLVDYDFFSRNFLKTSVNIPTDTT